METVKRPAEQRVLLQNVSWETYRRLITEREERRKPRFFYDRGVLELMSPSGERDVASRLIALLVDIVADEQGIDVENAGSTTFRREDLGRGFEANESFYFSENAARVRQIVRDKGDLVLDEGDPPPDLIVEIDITNPSLNKLPIYAGLGVAELWRHDGERLRILRLENEEYVISAESGLLPTVTAETSTRLVPDGLTLDRPAWRRKVRDSVSGSGTGSD